MKKLPPATQFLILSACLMLMMSFGLRSSYGLFVKPISEFHGWGRDVISTALAIQNLAWGVIAVFAGGLADKFGNVKVIIGAALFYAAGLFLTTQSDSPLLLNTSAGMLVGAGIAGTSFGLILPALARAVPPERRQWALGVGTAAGSLGQFAIVPLSQTLLDGFGWVTTLHILSATALLMIILSIPLAPYSGASEIKEGTVDQPILEALSEAFKHKSYLLLLLGFFVCGFHLAFITVHMPGYLSDLGFAAKVGAWSLSIVGIANMVGSYLSGVWSAKLPKRYILCSIYFLRSVVILLFLVIPPSLTTVVLFSIGIGLLWLATVPPTSGLVAIMFGTRYMALLYGFVFLSHQIGSFMGVYLGGFFYERSEQFQVLSSFCGQYLGFAALGDASRYNIVWLISIALGLLAALVHWPIKETGVGRFAQNTSYKTTQN